MYTSFFGLNEKPFTITPDPRYLFMSERHGEGLAHLVYGVTESGGFIQLTGEVGTGKTTLVRTLLGQIPAEVDIALILNPQLTAQEFLTTICEELGIDLPRDKDSTKALVDALNRHLLEAHSRGRRIILLVDEAQNLSEGVLEQLRLLTNLETARQKLLQIILIAQPELRQKLAQDSLRQLAQRVTGRYHLEPLSRDEAFRYIDHRLRVAGALTEIFEPAAKREVYRLSGGVPRVMNVICDRALLGAYSRESRTIDKRMVRKAASEVSGQTVTPVALKWLVPVLGVASLVLAGSVLWSVFSDGDAPGEATTELLPLNDDPLVPETDVAALAPTVVDSPDVVPEPVRLDQVLAESADNDAYGTLLNLWGVEYDSGAGSACGQAEAGALRCFYQRGTWSTLRQLDRPVVLTLTGNDGTTHQMALVGLGEDSAELAVGAGPLLISLDELSKYWFGQFMLVWRPVNGDDQPIGPGMRSENVRWLRQSLAALDSDYEPSLNNSDLFDDELEQQLIAFQRQHRLEADGLAGQKTQIIINSLLALEGTPRLSEIH
jgi:general secretion pathway protein A